MFSFKTSLLLLVIFSVVACNYMQSKVFKFPDALCDYTNDSVYMKESSVFKFPDNQCDYTNESEEKGASSEDVKLAASADQMVETRRI
ncbi:hypothetical protein B9Z55_016969 [Caenorhabditis nigoni]|uniref:Uncharacterized protein n=1 Tax=Caenorhabditis nigoni TaxID=1611254 RepID=A0A2G5T702_9PELO|nr:hypothetical protein B9Z55_016969 [Caenorhabditis nigoni]